jgi:hypothetical protein
MKVLGIAASQLQQSSEHHREQFCQKRRNLFNEISNLRRDFPLSCYPQGFIDSVINFEGTSRLNKEQKSLGSVHVHM